MNYYDVFFSLNIFVVISRSVCSFECKLFSVLWSSFIASLFRFNSFSLFMVGLHDARTYCIRSILVYIVYLYVIEHQFQ